MNVFRKFFMASERDTSMTRRGTSEIVKRMATVPSASLSVPVDFARRASQIVREEEKRRAITS